MLITKQFYDKELEKLELISGVLGTALINRNGLIITTQLPRDFDERKFGAMVATLYGSMEAASATLSNDIINITVEYEDYQLIVFKLNDEILLATLIELKIDLGLILIEIEEFIKSMDI